jgi:hypothetical protein
VISISASVMRSHSTEVVGGGWWADRLSKPGPVTVVSIGMTVTGTLHQAVRKIPEKAWTPAYDAGGTDGTAGTEWSSAWVVEITDYAPLPPPARKDLRTLACASTRV